MDEEKEVDSFKNYEIERLTDEAKTVLARLWVMDKVFITWNPKEAQMCFLPVMLGGVPPKAGAVYEHLDLASERSINNLPIFMSCHFVHMDDMVDVHSEARRLALAIGLLTQEEYDAVENLSEEANGETT